MKLFSLLIVSFLIYTFAAFAQDTSLAVSNNGNVGIGTVNPATKLDVNGAITLEGELRRNETGNANLVPIAYANVDANGTIRTDATTNNVTFDSHTAGSGNYYFTIAGYSVYYTNTMCVATLLGEAGEISWASSGGGSVLYIGTRNSSGVSEDKPFTFIVYKK